ncbi:Uncharacterized protein HZ326_11478 [Fusarium oxysporum f. sp. albedinis]|nr:Uncharacterized protein HZ326_11478 [Fusarium oxysporum f. sp. albedinis]
MATAHSLFQVKALGEGWKEWWGLRQTSTGWTVVRVFLSGFVHLLSGWEDEERCFRDGVVSCLCRATRKEGAAPYIQAKCESSGVHHLRVFADVSG